MTAHVWDHFIAPLTRAFQDPPGRDPEGFFADLANELEWANVYQLQEAAALIKRSRTVRSFPTMAECIAAVKDTPLKPQPKKSFDDGQDDIWHPRRMRFANDLLRSEPLAKQAAEERWLYPLWDFVRTHMRMPDGRELRQVEARGAMFNRRIAECQKAAQEVTETKPKQEAKVGTFQSLGSAISLPGSFEMIANAYEVSERRALQSVFPRMVHEAAE